jgi:hypothetical protein
MAQSTSAPAHSDHVAHPASSSRSLAAARTGLGPTLVGTVLPFALVLYLALRGGGYDAVVRSEAGIAVWWLVLLGSLAGVIPAARLNRRAWLGLGLLLAFAAWGALAIAWSESAERSVGELARVSAYVGVFALALCIQGRDGLRRTVYAVAAALGVVACLALLSRLHPAWFPANDAGLAFDNGEARLNYPVNYWNALAALMAMAAPLLLAIAVDARHLLTRAIATAVVPIVALVTFYTFSRAGVVEMLVAVGAFVVLHPRRVEALPGLTLGGVGAALLVAAAAQREELKDGLLNGAAGAQADEMIVIVLIVSVGVGLLSAAIGLATRHGLVSLPKPSRRFTLIAVGAAAAIAFTAALGAGAPGELSDRWEEFKRPVGPEGGNTAARLESASGNGRYQYWETAVEATSTAPLNGIGPGTYEFFWDREGPITGFVRDAHSLFLETAAELGVIGLLLLTGFLGLVIVTAAARAFTGPPAATPWYAAAAATFAAFVVAAASDWVWEVAVIPAAFLLLAAAVVGENADQRPQTTAPRRTRLSLAALAVAGTAVIALPLLGTQSVRASKENVDAGNLSAALSDAEAAADRTPWAATPDLQQALVLELQGDLDAAAARARAATEDEPTNWQNWFVLSRIERARGSRTAAAQAYEEARELNPRSPLFSE